MAKKAKKAKKGKKGTLETLPVPKVQAEPVEQKLELIQQSVARSVVANTEMLKGAYSNVASVSHTPREFILDFFSKINEPWTMTARVITSPQHAKEIASVLLDQIKKYEKEYGKIITDAALKPKRKGKKKK